MSFTSERNQTPIFKDEPDFNFNYYKYFKTVVIQTVLFSNITSILLIVLKSLQSLK